MHVSGVPRGFYHAVMLVMAATAANAAEPNYDEAAVRSYSLPEILRGPDAASITTPDGWRHVGRAQQLKLLEQSVYGRRLPAAPVRVDGEIERAEVKVAGCGSAIRLQARLRLGADVSSPTTDVLLYLPVSQTPVPVFLCLNFKGNQAQHDDPAIHLSRAWLPNDAENGIVGNRATEASRGKHARRWPVGPMLSRGYGLATACHGDLFPDHAGGRPGSVLPSLGRPVTGPFADDEPGAIAAWAWGLSRILDWLITLPEIDASRVIVVGHSRLGKAALWAGACDERFAMVVSNESGCGGAALLRRKQGETVAQITRTFPHWFCPAFAAYAGRESELPTDAHGLMSLVAPRPLYVASAIEDRWCDPPGEFLAARAAGPAWRLFGLDGLAASDWPAINTPIGATVGYHVRSGGHDLIEYDWQRFADHADRTLRRSE